MKSLFILNNVFFNVLYFADDLFRIYELLRKDFDVYI